MRAGKQGSLRIEKAPGGKPRVSIFHFHGTIYIGLVATKPVIRVFDKVRFKPACSATGTSKKIESWLVVGLDIILPNMRITKVLIRLLGCPGWSAPFVVHKPPKTGILGSRPISIEFFCS